MRDGSTVDVVVVGGGLAGLVAAATAAGGGRSVLLLDGQPGGGRAATDEVGRYRFNRGAHALVTTGPGRRVLRDLGIRVTGSRPPLRGAMGRLGDRTGLLPGGPVSLARTDLLSAREKVVVGKLLAMVKRWRPDELADITAAQWFDRLALTGNARLMVETITRVATYSADLDVVSADTVATQVPLALEGVDYLHGGWATLVEALRSTGWDRGVLCAEGVKARAVVPEGGHVRVETDEGDTVLARRVVLAPGSPAAAAGLLPAGAAGWGDVGPPVRTACLDLGLRDVPPTQVLFGLETALYMSCHAPAAAGLAPRGAATAQLMWYLRAGDDPTADEARRVLAEHAAVAGIDVAGAEESRYLHRMVAVSAQPTPATGGLRGRPTPGDAGADGVYLAGDWVGPTGYLADASLVSGATAARAAVDDLAGAVTVHAVGKPAA